jgi:hypothetical protein
MRIIVITGYLLLASLLPLTTQADELVLTENAPEIYLVKKRDTLWDISNTFLRDPWLWPKIWEINIQLDNPHLIFPGDQIYLVWVDGQPRLRVRRGEQSRTVMMTPHMRVEPLDSAIPVIPLEEIGAWLNGHRIVSPDELDEAPYVVASDQRHLLTATGGQLYARGTVPEGEKGFGIYRSGQVYKDPDTREVLGLEAQDIGSARLLDKHDDRVLRMEVTRVTEEVRLDDRLLVNESRTIAAGFQPHAPAESVTGVMIAVDGGVNQIATLDVVAINLGEREGIEIGHVLAIYQTGEMVRDERARQRVQMPDTRAGLLMVFRTFEKMSYGIVLKSNRPLAVLDRVGDP